MLFLSQGSSYTKPMAFLRWSRLCWSVLKKCWGKVDAKTRKSLAMFMSPLITNAESDKYPVFGAYDLDEQGWPKPSGAHPKIQNHSNRSNHIYQSYPTIDCSFEWAFSIDCHPSNQSYPTIFLSCFFVVAGIDWQKQIKYLLGHGGWAGIGNRLRVSPAKMGGWDHQDSPSTQTFPVVFCQQKPAISSNDKEPETLFWGLFTNWRCAPFGRHGDLPSKHFPSGMSLVTSSSDCSGNGTDIPERWGCIACRRHYHIGFAFLTLLMALGWSNDHVVMVRGTFTDKPICWFTTISEINFRTHESQTP